jgi:hypothetical protein
MAKKRRPDLPPTRRGYSPHEAISAVQKAIRRSQVKEAVYWATELFESGYHNWLWSRLFTICSEDIGPADRYLPATLAALYDRAMTEKKKGAGGMETVHAAILLATAPKSRIACWMVLEQVSDHADRIEIPDEALDQHTRAGRQMGRGYEHFVNEAQQLIDPEDAAQARGFDGVREELAHLEGEGLSHWVHTMQGAEPTNPWRPRGSEAGGSYLPAGGRQAEEERVAKLFDTPGPEELPEQ